jgi:class 3 adenylate cyclase
MVAVLFTDLVGSRDLMARLGEVAFDGLRRAHFTALAQAIERTGGEEIKNTGDGVMATFNSVVDAIGCAVAMQQATDRHARRAEASLAIRIGLSVGEVIFEGDDVFGAPVVEAARLVAAAQSGKILTTAIARALAAGRSDVEYSDLAPLELKGLPQPVAACEVLWEPLPESTVPMPALLTDVGRIFVGRGRELERLGQLWQEAAAGERRVALIAGEPGVGKTRLAAELAVRVHEEGATVLAGRCDEDLGVPYQPFVEALRQFVDHVPDDTLGRSLGRYGGELVRLVPELAERLPELPAPLRSDPETERYRLFDAVAAWLAATAAGEAVLLVIDDLQWATKPTLLLLRHVARSADVSRVALLATYRDTELGREAPLVDLLADLCRQAGVERLSLAGLESSGVVAFMERSVGRPLGEKDLLLARAIHAETEGNPFFVHEVLRHLAETAAIEQREGSWTTGLPIDELGIPEGVRDVVGRRVARLSEAADRLLRVAAVVGSEFELAVLQQAELFEEEGLVAALDEAASARLIQEVPQPGARYRFAHALVRDTLYQELSAARRVTLHRRVAQAIEAVHADHLDDQLPALAHHWSRASTAANDRAVEYTTRAGDLALAQLAHDEAVRYYRQALDLLGSASRRDAGRQLVLMVKLGEAQRRAGHETYRKTLLEAAHIAQERGDAHMLAQAALGSTRGFLYSVTGKVDFERVRVLEAALASVNDDDTPVRARLLATLALELTFSPDRKRCLALSDEALAIARRLGDPDLVAQVFSARHIATIGPDTFSERLREARDFERFIDDIKDPAIRARALITPFRSLLLAGDVDEAGHCLDRADQLARDLGQPASRWSTTYLRCAMALIAGDVEQAEQLARTAFELGRLAGQPDAPWAFALDLFLIRFEQGRVDEEVKQLLDDVLFDIETRGATLHLANAAAAVAAIELGRPEEARELLVTLSKSPPPENLYWAAASVMWAEAAVRLHDNSQCEVLYRQLGRHPEHVVPYPSFPTPSVRHHLGLLATALRRLDEADRHFAGAVADHVRIRAPTYLARTRLEWGSMLLARRQPGDAERAKELLGQSLDTARELGLGNVERRAVTLLQ